MLLICYVHVCEDLGQLIDTCRYTCISLLVVGALDYTKMVYVFIFNISDTQGTTTTIKVKMSNAINHYVCRYLCMYVYKYVCTCICNMYM